MMRYTLIIAIIIAAFFSCAPKSGPTPIAASKTTPTTTPEKKPVMATNMDLDKRPVTAEVAKGQETYTAKCGRCHGLKNTADYTAKEWIGWLDKMAPKARLDETEKANVLAYVQFYAKSGS